MKKGFTLIELLVVVLIIGILSAIALPQYTKAVRRARIAEARINLRALADATDRYVLENGTTDGIESDGSNLDISLSNETKNWNYVIDECINNNYGKTGCMVIAFPQFESDDYEIDYFSINYNGSPNPVDDVAGHFLCYSSNEAGNKICDSLGTNRRDKWFVFID